MKSKIIKILLSSVLSVGLIAGTVFALNTVNTGDTLTASSWNEIVNKLTSFDTNSTDLVTKSYVDSAISAGSGLQPGTIDWRDCEYKGEEVYMTSKTLSCSVGYDLVDHSCSINAVRNTKYSKGQCYLTGNNSLFLLHSGNYPNNLWATQGSIKCCKVTQ